MHLGHTQDATQPQLSVQFSYEWIAKSVTQAAFIKESLLKLGFLLNATTWVCVLLHVFLGPL